MFNMLSDDVGCSIGLEVAESCKLDGCIVGRVKAGMVFYVSIGLTPHNANPS